MDFVFLYVTCPDKEEALKISSILVNEKLVGCANIFDSITSVYIWEGSIEKSDEVVVILKTSKDLVKKARKKIKELHSHQVPCIASIKIDKLNKKYANWLEGSLG